MVQLMGGDENSKPFNWFVDLCVKAYLSVRPYQESIVSLVSKHNLTIRAYYFESFLFSTNFVKG